MAMLEETHAGVSRCVFVLAAVSSSIIQSIIFYQQYLCGENKCFDVTYLEVAISEFMCGK